MKDKNKKALVLLLSFFGVATIAGSGMAVGTIHWLNKINNSKKDNSSEQPNKPSNPGSGQTGNNNPVEENKKDDELLEVLKFKNSAIFSVGNKEFKITDEVERKVNDKFYETQLELQYGKDFKYPGWNYNYKENKTQNINGEEINSEDKVSNEKVEYTNSNNEKLSVRYNDPNFIMHEIKNNSLKIHPAARTLFEKEIEPSIKAVAKSFSIPSNYYGPTSLGLYVAPGEIATLEFDSVTLEKMKEQNIDNFQIVINSSYWDDESTKSSRGKIPYDAGISNRYPFTRTVFNVQLQDLIENNGIFKFGSPFGGTISAWVNTRMKESVSNVVYNSFKNFDFKISGALEMLSYVHKLTTKEDWDNQIMKIKKGEIAATGLALDFLYGSSNIGFTSANKIAHKNIDDIVYPFEVIEKWNDFVFLSQYFNSRDLKDKKQKLNLEFSDDIWPGGITAVAWGGVNTTLWAPLDWAGESFLSGTKELFIKNNWGTFHEINHNFQEDDALFLRKDHGKTNQTSMANLSLISDSGRWRNFYNPYADFAIKEWSRLQGLWATIHEINRKEEKDDDDNEYNLQNILVRVLGTYDFVDYIRHDVANNPKTGGFKEIVELSNFFKLNLWPAMANYHRYWSDNWPASYEAASVEQKQEIDKLTKSFKSFDFLGNIYASGSYKYNQDKNDFEYTNDMQVPFEIPAGRDYSFDLEKGINFINKNFKWSKLEFNPKTKLGGELKLDPSNSKKIIYTPNKNAISEIDEFDMAIIPDDFEGKAENYVDKYMWKVKIRQVANLPLVSVYKNNYIDRNKQSQISQEYDFLKDEKNILDSTISDPQLGILSTTQNITDEADPYYKWERAKVAFNFVAPKTGKYSFKVNSFSWMFIVNKNLGEKIWWQNSQISHNKWEDIATIELQEGEILPLEIYLATRFRNMIWNNKPDDPRTTIKMTANLENGEEINVFDYATVPWANELSSNPKEFFDEKYKLKPRKVNYSEFQTSLLGSNVAREEKMIKKINENNQPNYTFEQNTGSETNIDEKLSYTDSKFFEDRKNEISFKTVFKDYQNVRSIVFNHRTNNHYESRPTSLVVRNENNEIIYSGSYGEEFKDRDKQFSILNLDKSYKVKELRFELKNESTKVTSAVFIVFDSINFYSDILLSPNRFIPIQEEGLRFYGDWEIVENDPSVNISNLNNVGVKTAKEKSYMEFEIFSSGFDIVGQKNTNLSDFEVYINDELFQTVSAKSDKMLNNQILFSYNSSKKEGELVKVKIVNKENKDLFINYLQTYGKNVYLKTNK